MPDERLTDQAWRQIVNAAPRGVRGLVFRMSIRTYRAVCAERRVPALPALYSVPVEIVRHIRDYVILLEER